MTMVYVCAAALALFGGALPLGVFSVIWDQMSENMTVGIPYIAILRLLLALGAVAAVILAQRLRRLPVVLDLVIASLALEAMCLFGFSLSRVFWHLAVWTVLLGFGVGMSLALMSLRLAGSEEWKVNLVFAAAGVGTLTGTGLMARVLNLGRSWHTACQFLAILQILIFLSLFLLRRVGLRSMEQTVRARVREKMRRREEKGRALDGKRAPEQVRSAFLVRLVCAYGAAALSCVLLLAACLWPSGVLAELERAGAKSGAGSAAVRCILWMGAGFAAGGLIAGLLRWKKRTAWAAGCAVSCLFLCAAAVLLERGTASALQLQGVALCCGAGQSTVLAQLLLTDDARLDEDAVSSLTELIPAFFLGGWAVITPMTQLLFRSGNGHRFALWMLLFLAVQALLLTGACGRESE